MVRRSFWIQQIEDAWKDLSIVFLAGVRRVGKTYLCQSLEDVEYYSCDLPRVQKLLRDPEKFFKNKQGKRIALDEIHVLKNPSNVLKIAADFFPNVHVIATASSALTAKKKFSDTLTGRKNAIHLTPLLSHEGAVFGNNDLEHRMLFGGLPPFFLKDVLPEKRYTEWLSSYFTKDVQEVFTVDNRHTFLSFIRLLLSQSGGFFEASRLSHECGVSRPTIMKYLDIAEQTYVAKIVRPYSSDKGVEIRSSPKVYGFDTGFVCYAKGWQTIRNENFGDLWEHIVLNNLMGFVQERDIKYWRTKGGHEVDFILEKQRNSELIAVECKWNSDAFESKNLRAFRRRYPHGPNYVVSEDVQESFEEEHAGMTIQFVSLETLCSLVT